ncbi:MAG: hypothetical protein ACT4TC_12775 [Myxococcaceae bacterium]
MRGLTLASLCLLGFAAGCEEDKHEERKEATATPVKLAMDPNDLMKEGALAEVQKALGKTEFKRVWAEGKLDQDSSAALRKFQELCHRWLANRRPRQRTRLVCAEIFSGQTP